jgi:hypothetical protein
MAKQAFEGYARSMGVRVQHYHADNGRFCENVYMNDMRAQGQTISFCGVNTHFQSGIAERRIREIQDGARTSLIHAKHRWPTAIESNLWLYALRHRNDVYNSTQRNKQELSPIELFSNSKVRPKLKHFHPFGCPAYRVDNAIQGSKNHPKWLERAKPVVYLGSSPRHARSVSLVFDLQTAHVSPQFHLWYDNLFETVSTGRINPQAKQTNWQRLCGFLGNDKRDAIAAAPPMSTERRDETADGTAARHEQQPTDEPDIPNDPDGDHSVHGNGEDMEQEHTAGAVGPFGNPIDVTVPISVSRAGRTRIQTLRFIESQEHSVKCRYVRLNDKQ